MEPIIQELHKNYTKISEISCRDNGGCGAAEDVSEC
jgi:hypothetical protein